MTADLPKSLFRERLMEIRITNERRDYERRIEREIAAPRVQHQPAPAQIVGPMSRQVRRALERAAK